VQEEKNDRSSIPLGDLKRIAGNEKRGNFVLLEIMFYASSHLFFFSSTSGDLPTHPHLTKYFMRGVARKLWARYAYLTILLNYIHACIYIYSGENNCTIGRPKVN